MRSSRRAGYEVAFETALAASLQDIITDTEQEAKDAIAFLHENRAGRATFLPLDRMRPSRDTLDLGRAAGMSGVRGAALDILTFDPKFRPALEVLLGRVFVCETLDDALRASHDGAGLEPDRDADRRTGAADGGADRRASGRPHGQHPGPQDRDRDAAKPICRRASGTLRKRQNELAEAERAREQAETALAEAQAARQAAQGAVPRPDAAPTSPRAKRGGWNRRLTEARRPLEIVRSTRSDEARVSGGERPGRAGDRRRADGGRRRGAGRRDRADSGAFGGARRPEQRTDDGAHRTGDVGGEGRQPGPFPAGGARRSRKASTGR